MKRYKDVYVGYRSDYFDIEIDDVELDYAKRCGIDINDDEELVQFHLENNFQEHMDLLELDDFGFEIEKEDKE